MAKKGNRFEEESPEPVFDPADLERAVDEFAAVCPPVPKGIRPSDYKSTETLLRQFRQLHGDICNGKQLHDALIEHGYHYQYGPGGFQWLIGKAGS